MTLHVRDIMVTDFDTIHMNAPVVDAIHRISNGIVRKSGYKTSSLMVIDDFRKLGGVVTMFDILYHLRPDFLNFGISGEEIRWEEGQLRRLVDVFQGKKVHHIMTRHIVGASLDDHVMTILDRMVKNKYHRLPVLENDKPVGIVYLSDIYFHLFSHRS